MHGKKRVSRDHQQGSQLPGSKHNEPTKTDKSSLACFPFCVFTRLQTDQLLLEATANSRARREAQGALKAAQAFPMREPTPQSQLVTPEVTTQKAENLCQYRNVCVLSELLI